jgi:hypothetical protein
MVIIVVAVVVEEKKLFDGSNRYRYGTILWVWNASGKPLLAL